MSTEDNSTTIADLFAKDDPAPAHVPAEPAPQQFAPVPTEAQFPPAVTPPNGLQPPAPVPAEQPQAHTPPAHSVPLAELLSERRERQQLAQQNRELMEALQRLAQPPQPAPQPIDPIADPEGAYSLLAQQVQSALLSQKLDFSEARARDKHGDEVVDRAFEAAKAAGYSQAFINRPDAYGEMVRWYQGQQLAQEIGTDPVAYRARIAAEIKAELLQTMRNGAGAPPNLPPSLSTATRVSSAPEVLEDDQSFFRQSLKTPRRG